MQNEIEGRLNKDEAKQLLASIKGFETWEANAVEALTSLLTTVYREAYCDGVVEAVTQAFDIDDLDEFIDATDVPNADNE